MADIDLKAIFNEVNTIASLASTSVAGTLASKANAIPVGKTTSDLSWAGNKKRLSVPFNWSSVAADWGIASKTDVALICGWEWGGTYQGEGQFIANLRLALTVQSIGLGQSFDVSGEFDDPTPIGDPPDVIASLGGSLTLKHNYLTMLEESFTVNFNVRGDGNGTMAKA